MCSGRMDDLQANFNACMSSSYGVNTTFLFLKFILRYSQIYFCLAKSTLKFRTFIAGATLGISIHGFTILLGSDFMSNFMGSSAKILKSTGSHEPKEPVLTRPLNYKWICENYCITWSTKANYNRITENLYLKVFKSNHCNYPVLIFLVILEIARFWFHQL